MNPTMRKLIVSLKHKPQNIPLIMLVLCCFIYTFNLTAHSNASMYVSSRIIALYVFIITLSSILVIFSFLNAYSSRQRQKKKSLMMHGIVYFLIVLQGGLDLAYWRIMAYEIMYRDDPVPLTLDIANSMNGAMFHLTALTATLLMIILTPVYHRMLMKIDTSVEDEEDVFYGAEELAVEEELE